ncbi:14040_t:CDS:2 [Acaulospora morrowiae]|uniref:14040_t:CDS:1 n=1 Tax=Acaulospora morrowiae TaxID=94023 RepID=A0A9N8VAA4_9GLOM|nr:14040_t:CDS:2 [Acaulospora morrowiae]
MEKPSIRRLGSKIYDAITSAMSLSQTLDESRCELPRNNPRDGETISLDAEEDSCSGCANPCSTHPNYPYLKIDRKSTLEGTVKPYVKHVLISTGKSDWQTHIEEDTFSLAAYLHKVLKSNNSPKGNKKDSLIEKKNKVEGSPQTHEDSSNEAEKPRIVITNSSRQNNDSDSKGNDVLLFPDNILIKNVTPKQAAEFYKRFLSTPISSLNEEKEQYLSTVNFTVEQMPYKAVIVICSHKRRDKRCGVTGPILKEEFDRVLKEKNLDVESHNNNGIAVFLSSHTGGHKFAGNIIVYRDGQGIWYGRVIPCHVKSIVELTVLEGKVIKDLYRGSMNGSFAPGKGGKLDW